MESIWSLDCRIPPHAPLDGDRETDIAVIGAGMAGILIADALREAGREVVVLEADRIASGQTRGTTAKITSQHGLCYAKLIRTVGRARARQYAMANEAAGLEYRRIILSRSIPCSYEEKDSFVYGDDAAILRKEAEAAESLGLPASFTREYSLPVPSAGAVRFSHQAQFDPLAFLRSVSEGLTIFEKTPVRAVRGHELITPRGTVRARQIVFACHYPFVNFPGLYFARMHQERSYVIALENAKPVGGMFLGVGSEAFSFRDCGGLLLLGGGGHRTGDDPAGGKYALLRRKAAELYPASREVARWSAQDGVTADGIPYIGRYSPLKKDWYVAAGFGKWGMTGSMTAAMLLRDALCARDNPYSGVFRPCRLEPASLSGIADEVKHAFRGLTRSVFLVPEKDAETLPNGHGGIVSLDAKKAGVYNDGGTLRAVVPRCPHLGCQLEWNPDERTWDCPCHGSRFDSRGKLLSGPAQNDLKTP